MALSRPPNVRSVTASTPPPLSPRESTDRDNHHHKSSLRHGAHSHSHSHANTSSSNSAKRRSTPNKTSRPAPLSRRTTPQYLPRINSRVVGSSTLNHRERGEDDAEDHGIVGESFLSFCSVCEKQLHPSTNNYLYCSESCRQRDLSNSHPSSARRPSSIYVTAADSSPPSPAFSRPLSLAFPSDGPDIVPRASPTMLGKPHSYFTHDPFLQPSHSTPQSPGFNSSSRKSSTSALASLRELSSALDASRTRSSRHRSEDSGSGSDDQDDASPPSDSPISRSASGVWNYVPFTSSSATNRPSITYSNMSSRSYSTAPTTPSISGYSSGYGLSYTPSGTYGSRAGGSTTELVTMGLSMTSRGMDRPLPPRSGGFSHRPKSVDLVTPISGPVA